MKLIAIESNVRSLLQVFLILTAAINFELARLIYGAKLHSSSQETWYIALCTFCMIAAITSLMLLDRKGRSINVLVATLLIFLYLEQLVVYLWAIQQLDRFSLLQTVFVVGSVCVYSLFGVALLIFIKGLRSSSGDQMS